MSDGRAVRRLPQTQPITGEQVIVKFAPHTQAREVTVGAITAGPDAQAHLAGLADSLSAELGIPLRIIRPTSGQELVVAINAGALAAKLVAYLGARADVKSARLLDAADKTRQRYWNPTVAVEFQADSTLGQVLAAAPAGNTEDLKGFAAEVGDDVGFPVSASAPQTVELVIDMSSVATDLVERFKRRPDVEYAQRDLLMRPFGD